MNASDHRPSTSETAGDGTESGRDAERLHYLALATGDAVYDWDIPAGTVWRNETSHAIYSPHELITPDRRWWEERVHADDRQRVRDSLADAFPHRRSTWSEQYRFRRADGGYATVLDRGSIIYDHTGQAVRVVGAMTDITERDRAEGAMQAGEARYRALVEAMCDDVLTLGHWDADGASEDFKRWWEQLTGIVRSDEEWMRTWIDMVHPDDRDRVVQAWTGSAQTRAPYHIEYRVRAKSGEYRHILVRAVPVQKPERRLLEYAGMMTDITDLRRLEEQLRQAQKMEAVGRLAGGVAHDFNNLLTIIQGYSELLLGRLSADEPTARLVTEIRNAGDRGMAIIAQLLAFGRKAVIQPAVLDLNAVVADAETMLRRLIGEDIELTATFDPALWRVKADRVQLDQILLNLAVNAWDAMPLGGRLVLTTRNVSLEAGAVESGPGVRPGDYVRLSVTDTGCGMDEETKARVFEPFFTTKDVGKGTGMGLAVVYGIVQQSGGYIDVKSQPNEGSSFDIYLPRCQDEAPAEERAQASPSSPMGHETVVLVEDEDAVRRLAREILTQHGYTVLEAKDGPDALRLCQRHAGPIDLLVTDVVMPRMSGLRLADRLREQRPQIKTLFISGYLDDVLSDYGASAGDITLLQKPFAVATLTHKVRDVLDRP